MRAVVLLPTLNRQQRLVKTLASIKITAPVDICVATDVDDITSQTLAKDCGCMLAICPIARMGSVYAWNVALRAAPDYDIYIMGADDLTFLPGWYDEALRVLDTIGGNGVVGFNTDRGKPGNEYAEAFLMTRDFLIHHNGGVFAHPVYKFWGIDVEACSRARAVGLYAYAENAHVKHTWTGAGAGADSTYQHAKPHLARDVETIEQRKVAGWSNDWQPIIGRDNGTLER